MFDPTGISAALSSVKAILDILKNAKDAQLAMSISREVAGIQSQLLDVQQQALSLQNENQALKNQIQALTNLANDYELRHGVYFKKGTQDAYCPACFGANQKAVPLISYADVWQCSIHKDVSFPKPNGGPGFALIERF
jgi:hypothetical protein